MADKLRNVRISVVNKDLQSSDPVNVITSAESVILDGTNVNIKIMLTIKSEMFLQPH